MDHNAGENQAAKVEHGVEAGAAGSEESLVHLGKTEEQAAARISKEESGASKRVIDAALGGLAKLKLS